MPCNAAAPKGPAFWFLKLLLFRLFRVREGIEFPTMVGYVGGNAIFPPPHRGAVPLASCTGLALLRSLRTHSDATAIVLPNPAARAQLSFLFLSWTSVLCPSLAGTSFFLLLLFCGTPCHASSRPRLPRRVLPHQHAHARRARTNDAQRRTIRRAVRRSG